MTAQPATFPPPANLAEIPRRFGAALIDTVISAVIIPIYFWGCAFWMLWGAAGGDSPNGQDKATALATTWTILFLVPILTGVLVQGFSLLNGGQTIGKRIMKIRVVTGTGGPPSLGRALLRSFPASIVVLLILLWMILPGLFTNQLVPAAAFPGAMLVVGLLFLVDFFALLASPTRQAVHDRLAGTYVIDRVDPASAPVETESPKAAG